MGSKVITPSDFITKINKIATKPSKDQELAIHVYSGGRGVGRGGRDRVLIVQFLKEISPKVAGAESSVK